MSTSSPTGNQVQAQESIRVRNTGEFKLKDKQGRNYQGINLKNQFGFIPEVIIIEKVAGRNNTLIVRAVLTPEEIELEEKRIKNLKATQPKKNDRTIKKSSVQKKE